LNKLQVAGRSLQILGGSGKTKTEDMTNMHASLTIDSSIIVTLSQDLVSFGLKFHILQEALYLLQEDPIEAIDKPKSISEEDSRV